MTTKYFNAAIAVLWLIAAGAAGLLVPVTTPSGWLVLAVAGTIPPLLFTHYSKPPAQTMSESIRQAIR